MPSAALPPSAPHHFTLAEANAALGPLRERLSRVMQLRLRLKALHADFHAAGLEPSLDLARGVDATQGARATPAQVRDAAQFHALLAALDQELEAIGAAGAQLKDLEIGLVDWPALHDGREVLLCWKLGEPEVAHWHDVAAGFAGRRPVAELAGRPDP